LLYIYYISILKAIEIENCMGSVAKVLILENTGVSTSKERLLFPRAAEP
jgi:hypothetical protein